MREAVECSTFAAAVAYLTAVRRGSPQAAALLATAAQAMHSRPCSHVSLTRAVDMSTGRVGPVVNLTAEAPASVPVPYPGSLCNVQGTPGCLNPHCGL